MFIMCFINITSKGPYLNVISESEDVPFPCNPCVVFTVFRVELSCTGRLDSDVTILMQLNLTINSSKNITVLNFKRRKMCYKSKRLIFGYFKVFLLLKRDRKREWDGVWSSTEVTRWILGRIGRNQVKSCLLESNEDFCSFISFCFN